MDVSFYSTHKQSYDSYFAYDLIAVIDISKIKFF